MTLQHGQIHLPVRATLVLGVGLAMTLGVAPAGRTDRGATPPCPQGAGLLREGVARFLPPEVECTSLPPSLALVEPAPPVATVPADWSPRPEFTPADDQGNPWVARIDAAPGTSLYGTGEIAGPLLRNGAVTEVWAKQPYRTTPGLPRFEYDDTTPNLYQAHPWVLAVRADGSAFGVLADTTYRLQIDLRDGIRLAAAVPFPVMVIDGAAPQQVLRRLGELTGMMPLPPLWAIGYQQSRFSYFPDAHVREIAEGFRDRALPCDVIWLDGDYMDGARVFTFHPTRFPDPAAMNAALHDLGFKSVWILNPGVKVEPGYFVYDQGVAGDHFLRTPAGDEYSGITWATPAAFPDFTRPDTRTWWADLHLGFLATGADGVWPDLNEPSLIAPPGGELPEDLVHLGGDTLPPGDHAQYHNSYGMLMARATYEGIRRAAPDRRPFILSRSNYIGGQRYAAAWTGDNAATWEHLRWSVTMLLNIGLSGQPFVGADIGGFFRTPSPELYARWIGVGALYPFSRTHTSLFTADQEPWSFGPDVEDAARTSLQRRYRLLPYLYTLFREASLNGLPVMRPVFFAEPADPALRNEDHAFLIGADVLVEPALTEDATHVFQLPGGIWREFTLVGEDPATEQNQPRLRVRGGAIVPLGRIVQNTAETLLDPLTLVVALDEHGRAEGSLYEDAGDGFGYLEGDYLLTTYVARRDGDTVVVTVAEEEGRRLRPDRGLRVELVTDAGVAHATGTDGSSIAIELSVRVRGTNLILRDGQRGLRPTAIKAVSKDPGIHLGGGNGSADDPTLAGATLQVRSTQFDETYDLPAANWSYIGRRGDNRGYVYRARRRGGPVTRVRIGNGRFIRIVRNDAERFGDLATHPDPIDVVLRMGTAVQPLCMQFGGETAFTPNRRFRARNAPPPVSCVP